MRLPRIPRRRENNLLSKINLRRLAEVVWLLKRIARSNQPEVWFLLEREFRLLRTWMETGDIDRQQDWNLRKLTSKLRRMNDTENRRAPSQMTKCGIEKMAWIAAVSSIT